ncbi:MAG: SidJ-related pseudokinase [Desulfobacterales bacterium]|nr:SidJ-related pseudokinase [Desulfobacterales bacterium]MCP4158648.1 SidJ-related pseudokinase [Deltaproteobacteria bacterium]
MKVFDELKKESDFSSLFLIIKNLASEDFHNKSYESESFIKDISNLIHSKKHENQSKSFFLYREIADILVRILRISKNNKIRKACYEELLKNIRAASGDKLRAIGASCATLPLDINPFPVPELENSVTEISLKKFLNRYKVINKIKWLGRCLLYRSYDKIVVLKFAKKNDSSESLLKESFWMNFLNENFKTPDFAVPTPIEICSNYLLSIKNIEIETDFEIHKDNIAIAFETTEDYYIYPNENENGMNEIIFQNIVHQNSKLLGELSGIGLIHTALIPLFHNRVQSNRREDDGLYLWEKGGRLDSWLSSCRYPNFGKSGLRDFEHIETFKDSNNLYREIGNHFLSFILVIGSFFRNLGKKGMEKSYKLGAYGVKNERCDCRDLFDIELFKNIINKIFILYFENFTGVKDSKLNVDNSFVEKLVSEMGYDKNMDEIIRVVDQKELSQEEFTSMLLYKGLKTEDISRIKKGNKDIVLSTGPHLGSFNGKISVPELTDYLVKASSLCIIGKFLNQN